MGHPLMQLVHELTLIAMWVSGLIAMRGIVSGAECRAEYSAGCSHMYHALGMARRGGKSW
eukprot:CAMPEP_0202919188 /NCGR_PEP_ID=MMETSP1392-20130828/75247_1 /ASSEMBLY_ACC=CAM_ASM_000868 /TAXON_ID=225041 /ORGANISM="Chlamydomonas chlamydogama, Strain SAG 11-48b" /LENGTH=59 /DNA_ID=CAMNT_0049612459 /DNA_START=211 /DNA_END=391 /DNA_ORIENTATION=-